LRATSVDGKTAQASLSGLEAGQTYYFQAYVDGGRDVATSDIKSFTIDNVMDVDASGFSLGYAETDIQVTVETSLPITVDLGGATWIKETKTKGLETYHKVFHISHNTDVESRSTTIKIATKNGEFSKEIPVQQGGGPIVIPDAVFKKYLIEQFDFDKDGEIILAEARNITAINVCTDSIESVQGIEFMPILASLYASGSWDSKSNSPRGKLSHLDVSNNSYLTTLNCSMNQLVSLDLRNNKRLKVLECGYNHLSNLDVSNNKELYELSCVFNQLTNLNVSSNTQLTRLHCPINQISNLDVSNNSNLEYLSCAGNQLSSLSVSRNLALEQIWCDDNQLIVLDVSNNKKLAKLGCSGNQLSSLDITDNIALTSLSCRNNYLSRLDVSKNESLALLDCRWNSNLTEIWLSLGQSISDFQYDKDVATIYYVDGVISFADANFKAYCVQNFDTNGDGEISIEEAKVVKEMSFDTDNISSIKGIEYFSNLKHLWCAGNKSIGQLTSIDVSKNTALTYLNCRFNQLTSLDVSNNTELTELACENNQLSKLDLSQNTQLVRLFCNRNNLSSLDVSYHKDLTYINCGGNHLSSLDVSANLFLEFLYCDNNQLTSLELSKNKALVQIECSYNQLTSLNVRNNTALEWLYCNENKLTTIDISSNLLLTAVWCDNNLISNLDISNNTSLIELGCNNNQLSNLDVSKNAKLSQLYCSDNLLKYLNVNKNILLTKLECFSNQLASIDVSKNSSLSVLGCGNNVISSLDVKNNLSLTKLECFGNQLVILDVSNNHAITELNCKNNPYLKEIWLKSNQTIPDFQYDREVATIYYVDPVSGLENGHEYVDLGLSVKWATCNVGARSPEEYGDYYAWGETSTKSDYSWSTYKWCNGSYDSLTKYNHDSSYGSVDNRSSLELSDDAARANWGGKWRMPTDDEKTELRTSCDWIWTTRNGTNGYVVKSRKNGNSIFLPAAGYRHEGTLNNAGSNGSIWSSTLSEGNQYNAYYLDFYSDKVVGYGYFRDIGRSVRPVTE
jgi:Leucine-rich repeat (LRR) protein